VRGRVLDAEGRVLAAAMPWQVGLEIQYFREVADEPVLCTVSIGIASATREMKSVTDWLQAADTALYQAKREGKNRIFAH